jgi:hypothetical protein
MDSHPCWGLKIMKSRGSRGATLQCSFVPFGCVPRFCGQERQGEAHSPLQVETLAFCSLEPRPSWAQWSQD